MRKTFLLLLVLMLLPASLVSAQGQSPAYAELFPVDLSAFPKISARLDVFDARGVFASGLKPDAVTVYENNQALPADSLTEMIVPLQLVVAVNQAPQLDVRDNTALSRFERAAQILDQWVRARPADVPDDYSLVSQGGAVINHASAADFAVGLNGFKPDFRAATSNLLSLSTAIDVVSAQTAQPGMKRAILFITPHTDELGIEAQLEPLMQRAVENKIRVFVWFMDLETTFKSASATAFANLAAQTGGAMFAYSGYERFPDPEVYFSGLRRTYALSYSSRLKAAGEYTLSVKVNQPSGMVDAPQQKFSIDIQPPNPFPLTNDLDITRRAPDADPYGDVLQPNEQEVKIIIEFPDGHPRPLTRTTLYVDSVIMDENTAAPFDIFTWDISAYTQTGEHQVMVEAVDTLGLQKQSISTPIMVTVVKPLGGGLGLLAKYRVQITIGAIALAGLTLLLILLGGRLRIFSLRAAQQARRAQADPLTQQVSAASPVATTPLKKKALSVPKKDDAVLMKLNPDGQVAAAAPLPLVETEIVFGTDPVQCTQIMNDPSISSVHARLRVTDDGGYLLLDNNSVAGTWVNYDLIPREGYRLAHGDMVHFGQLVYRFTLNKPPEIPKPSITIQPLEE
jgi:hypothetical protein